MTKLKQIKWSLIPTVTQFPFMYACAVSKLKMFVFFHFCIYLCTTNKKVKAAPINPFVSPLHEITLSQVPKNYFQLINLSSNALTSAILHIREHLINKLIDFYYNFTKRQCF